MKKVFINKLGDRYDCIISENGKDIGGTHTFYSLEAANEFAKKEMEKDLKEAPCDQEMEP